MAAATATQDPSSDWTSVPLSGLAAQEPLPFPLWLRTADEAWVLYRPAAAALDESHLGRLQAEGIQQLWIRAADRAPYFARVEGSLDRVLLDRTAPLERRADVLYGVATRAADDLLRRVPDRAAVQRAQKVMMATCGLLLREPQAFQALRRVMTAQPGLAAHGLTVGFLAMGLARHVLAADAGTLLLAGLAGLLHDVGRVGHEHLGHDPAHPVRGAELLRGLGLPTAVVETARWHHERWDGSGYPQGLRGVQIPELTRVVALVDTFDKVYTAQQPRVGVFDALRILAQAYRGCFDDRLAAGLVQVFR